jgi:uncharacterized small protein (DUF1192 family)
MSLMEDEEKPLPRTAPLPLETMGVEELEAYIAGLRAEMARAEAELERKRRQREAAAALFRTP